ncbi:LysR substrate-binding domain-containing protein [Eoetvoesiella caeni]|uniref:LysR family transcriptional regulator n=1 Tax=Eoetvoesiella caeni TaxID=645616 RepID=A0A366H4F9_9BURK|nr:LysR family transcriptional regulator [Eoetvoesiella caeni]MCI2810856.1 LysR family transcriptional regulator [Eoetvoesiella caeni]NYT56754.1 LysR family transcriptional regulator [Eoetvoesiella caeni]RBP35738.1 LysR family transcriptional regulator [Eoetvoesiella caeni]
MDRFDALQLFTRIVELGSFTQAASVLNVPRATATHAIKQLEKRLGARLLDRTTRQVKPTLDGQAFYERSKRVLAELEDAETSLSTHVASPRGTLRLDLHGAHATAIILPRIGEFRKNYPQIDVVISSGDRLVDLIKEDVDCVVRAGQPRDSSLIVKKLANMPQIICASPEYLARYGTPQHPRDLERHQGIGFFSRGSDYRYPFSVTVDGSVQEFKASGWMSVNDAECYTSAALAGCGLIQVPRFRLEEHLAAGRLVRVLTEWACPDLPVCALYPFHRQLSPRVRVFIDWARDIYVQKFGALNH